MVLTDTTLYGFHSKDSVKANCLIFLNGFTVSLATEVHSKPYAFKVYHPSKTFYFSAESQQALSQWIDYIRQATIKGASNLQVSSMDASPPAVNTKDLYSEAESSEGETETSKSLATPSPATTGRGRVSHKKSFGGSSSSNLNSIDDSNAPPPKEKYHLGFGSLKKFTKHGLNFSSRAAKEKKAASNSDVPVPTEQFRTYRKVPGNAGLQLGTNSMISPTGASDFVPPLLSSTEAQSHRVEHTRKASITSLPQVHQSAATLQPQLPAPATPPPQSCAPDSPLHHTPPSPININPKKTQKVSPYNFIHASNPNLVEFDFPTTRGLDFAYPRVNPANSWEAKPVAGQTFVTLKDLMLKKQEDDAKEMYNNRVNLGMEKKELDKEKERLRLLAEQEESQAAEAAAAATQQHGAGAATEVAGTSSKFSKIQSRSLPKTPDYAQSFKPDDSDIIMTRSREGQKLRDFGYEFISGDDPASGGATNSGTRAAGAAVGPPVAMAKRKGGLSWMGSDDKSSASSSRSGSFMRSKNKLADSIETFKTSSDKLFQMKTHTNQRPDKPAKPMMPLSLVKKSPDIHVYNMHSQNTPSSSGSQSIGHSASRKQSGTDFPGSDLRKMPSLSTPGPSSSSSSSSSLFTKFTFSKSKEKKLLGSPRPHRSFFGLRSAEVPEQTTQDHEIFSPIEIRVSRRVF